MAKITNKDKKIIGSILNMAQDDRTHIMYRDCLSWMETKMEEIERLALMLPSIDVSKLDKNDKELKEIQEGHEEHPYMNVVKTEYISTLQKMEWELEEVILDQKLGLDDGQREYLRQVVSDMFHKVLYDGEMLNLTKEQSNNLKKVMKEIERIENV